ncbi:DNA cytosine methyltransferase [Novosphingobium ginsenosidimutans]|uniref:DNA (cytosine-5-)-methyltransferase n=1 Tax=Novosphingobium ginsenosidimutans TaxID=1176536 RepID=A0A5B8S4U5_9SPHN|nr:DNA cytosine methyltransferase [Novosphingobium ginsenosidimutans]QEA16531.1 DNA cytosine methyltransferase [Novosphingobium ginsenosidimutans]
MTKISKISAIDLFCGVGGLSQGLKQAGVGVELGVDIDPLCRFPFEQNIKAAFSAEDVANIAPESLDQYFREGSIRLLAGCAPCQPFSTYSRSAKRARGADWYLVERFGEIVRTLKPELVTMENVPPLADASVFGELLGLLDGYYVDWDIVEAKQLGLPQTRQRLVLVASRLGPISLKLPSKRETTVRDAISGLPPLKAGDADADDPMHCASKLSDLNLKRIQASRPGGTWRDWPTELRAACHQKQSGQTYPSVYGRMRWDAQSPTITTQCFGYGNGRFGHPEQDRAISLREAAMLQGFPRAYKFLPDGAKPSFATFGRLIGNAVPVEIGQAIGELFLDHIENQSTQTSHY